MIRLIRFILGGFFLDVYVFRGQNTLKRVGLRFRVIRFLRLAFFIPWDKKLGLCSVQLQKKPWWSNLPEAIFANMCSIELEPKSSPALFFIKKYFYY